MEASMTLGTLAICYKQSSNNSTNGTNGLSVLVYVLVWGRAANVCRMAWQQVLTVTSGWKQVKCTSQEEEELVIKTCNHNNNGEETEAPTTRRGESSSSSGSSSMAMIISKLLLSSVSSWVSRIRHSPLHLQRTQPNQSMTTSWCNQIRWQRLLAPALRVECENGQSWDSVIRNFILPRKGTDLLFFQTPNYITKKRCRGHSDVTGGGTRIQLSTERSNKSCLEAGLGACSGRWWAEGSLWSGTVHDGAVKNK